MPKTLICKDCEDVEQCAGEDEVREIEEGSKEEQADYDSNEEEYKE